MRVKLRDIAERANVSLATVSRVINNHSSVDERTRSTILEIMTQLGYPLPEGRLRLLNSVEKTILVLTRSVEGRVINGQEETQVENNGPFYNDFDPLVIDGIEVVMRRFGLRTRIERIRLEEPSSADLAQLTQADGLIIVGGIVGRSLITDLENAGIPFVLAGAHLGEYEINCVLGDYLRSAAQAIKALVELGHRRIAFINGPTTTTTSQDKLAGFRLGLSEADLGRDDQLQVTATDFDPHSGYKATQELLRRTRHFSAILYASDLLSVGGMRALKDAGLNVPANISVMGFYNGTIAQFADPPLSTVNLDRQRLGEIAAQRLISMLDHQDFERLRIEIPMRLIMRSSTGPAPQR